MPHIEGKTIDELLRVDEITGSEIIPMSVYSEELSAYVTRGITVDDFFKKIYSMVQEAQEAISYVQEDMTAYVDELRAYDNALHQEDIRLDDELQKTNVRLGYTAEDLVLLHEHYHRIHSYAYEGIGYLDCRTQQIDSYAHNAIGHTEEMVVTSYERMSERVSYEHDWTLGYVATTYNLLSDEISTAYETLDNSMQASYTKLDAAIAYVAAYAEAGSGELAYQVKELHAYAYDNVAILYNDYDGLHAYAYEGIGRNSYINLGQDIILAQHANAISSLAQNIAYESYVNTIQSGHINTIYYENSTDAFNNWADPDDDNVKPQH